MKTLLIAIIIILSLVSCTSTKVGCDYKRGKMPRFRADIQVQGRLDSVLYHVPGRAVLKMYVAKIGKPVYVYYGYFRGLSRQRFNIGDKYTILFDSQDTGLVRRSVIKLNS